MLYREFFTVDYAAGWPRYVYCPVNIDGSYVAAWSRPSKISVSITAVPSYDVYTRGIMISYAGYDHKKKKAYWEGLGELWWKPREVITFTIFRDVTKFFYGTGLNFVRVYIKAPPEGYRACTYSVNGITTMEVI